MWGRGAVPQGSQFPGPALPVMLQVPGPAPGEGGWTLASGTAAPAASPLTMPPMRPRALVPTHLVLYLKAAARPRSSHFSTAFCTHVTVLPPDWGTGEGRDPLMVTAVGRQDAKGSFNSHPNLRCLLMGCVGCVCGDVATCTPGGSLGSGPGPPAFRRA